MNKLQEKYKKEVVPALMKELNLKNVMEVPAVKKIVINAGIGNIRGNQAAVDTFMEDVSLLAGQKPVLRKAKKSEAGFGIRKGDTVGVAVTLRGPAMWAFLEKFVTLVLPRVRDFAGLNPKSFDSSGNYTVGITEHTIFPEINPNTVKGIRPLEVTLVTSTDDPGKSRVLLEALGMPFVKEKNA